jgi:CBS domain-containing protein
MVKSYTGVRKVEKKEVTQVLVSDFMTAKLTTFRPEQTIDDVVSILIDKKLSGGPVLNDQGKLMGMISEGDCLKEIVKGKYTNTPNLIGLVKDHMTTNVITIEPDVSALDAAKKFLENRVRRFPVVKDGKLLGQISQRDVMRAVNSLRNETW